MKLGAMVRLLKLPSRALYMTSRFVHKPRVCYMGPNSHNPSGLCPLQMRVTFSTTSMLSAASGQVAMQKVCRAGALGVLRMYSDCRISYHGFRAGGGHNNLVIAVRKLVSEGGEYAKLNLLLVARDVHHGGCCDVLIVDLQRSIKQRALQPVSTLWPNK